jgi:cytochrome b subunit of formate dehydrogenase
LFAHARQGKGGTDVTGEIRGGLRRNARKWRFPVLGLMVFAALVGGQVYAPEPGHTVLAAQAAPEGEAAAPAAEAEPAAEVATEGDAAVKAEPTVEAEPAAEEAPTAEAVPSEIDTCLECHGDPSASTTTPEGDMRSLYIDREVYAHSVHGSLDCSMCHADAAGEGGVHEPDLAAVDCGMCHGEAEEYANSLHAKALAKGDGDAASCDDCHGTHDIRSSSDPLSMTHPVNLTRTCGVCHSDKEKMEKHLVSVMEPSDAYLKSAHAAAVAKGEHAANCSACHGVHDLLPSNDPKSKVYRDNIPATCGECHPKEKEDYDKSIHGRAMVAGVKDSPTCVDCHGEHAIAGPHDVTSAVSRQQVSRETCPRCHDDERIMKRYGVEVMRQASYMDSYHGMASAAGSQVVASCTSCHHAHYILPSDDPASTTHKANLPQTCGQCHAEANENFAVGPVHIIPTDPGQKALGIVRIVYLWLIGLTVGGMVLHNTLMMGRQAFTKFRRELKGPRVHKRFTKGQIIGHLLLTVSFVVLVISGFALRYPDSWLTRWFFFGDKGLAFRSVIHRQAGLVLVGLTVVNVIYVVFTKGGRKELGALWPRWKDAKDAWQNIKYFVGLAPRPPKGDRYTYSEKFEYWGLWWGSVLMIVTGFCMWYADVFLTYFPKVGLDIAALIHFYEAWLALLTIVIWHMYYMIFAPETYPMNWSWITGNITEEDFVERHPLEYEREVGPLPEGHGAMHHATEGDGEREDTPPPGAPEASV